MDRRSRLAALVSATVLALGALSHVASAAPKDAAARKIDQDAMNNDFLMADFPKAEENLKKAVDACGASGCSPNVKAQILVHLGIVQVNQGNTSAAEQSFTQAIQLDGAVRPEKDFTTPDIEKVFEAAKSSAGSSGGSGGGDTATPPGPGPEDGGEVQHDKVVEQMVNTPVPIWVTVPEGMPIGKVLVRYKPFGGAWKKLNLQKKRGGWGGNIPCNDVTTTGDLKYYISVLDNAGDPITSLGSLNKPYVTKVKNQLDGDPPALPHEPPPARCAAPEDCPPGLPGCPAAGARGDKGWGASCEQTKECQAGLICKNGSCEEGEEEGATDGPAGPHKKNWVSLTLSPDLAFVSGNDVCGRDSQANKGYACFIKDSQFGAAGQQYHGDPVASGNGNAIGGGLALSTVRAMLGYDRTFGSNIQLGARAGWAFNGGPQPDKGNAFFPFHLEARVSYWFGKDPFSRVGIRPYGFLGGGMAQVDTKVDVSVRENTCDNTADPNGCAVRDPQGNVVQVNPQMQTVEAWRKSGQSFVGVGGGVMYAITPNLGIVGDVKVSYMFPTSGIVLSPELTGVMGF